MTIDINQLLKELIAELENKFQDNFTGLVLFGSYARGTQKEHSDVDILLTFKKLPKSRFARLELIENTIFLLEYKFKTEINPVLAQENKLGESFLMIDIAEYSHIIIDKNAKINKLFSSIKTRYEKGEYEKIAIGDHYMLKV